MIYRNVNLVLIIAATLSFISALSGMAANQSEGIGIRTQRFLFFVVFIVLLSFVFNIINFEKNGLIKSEQIRELHEKIEYLENVLRTIEREIAEHLHGYLIFKLTEMANRVREGNLKDGAVDMFLLELRNSFSYENYSILTKNFVFDLPALYRLAEEWSGFMEITFCCQADRIASVPDIQKRETWNVIIELINNAYRHGAASKISIDLDFKQNGFLNIRAINVGNLFANSGRKGTGTQIFTIASDDNWSIENNDSGEVEVKLQIRFYSERRTAKIR